MSSAYRRDTVWVLLVVFNFFFFGKTQTVWLERERQTNRQKDRDCAINTPITPKLKHASKPFCQSLLKIVFFIEDA